MKTQNLIIVFLCITLWSCNTGSKPEKSENHVVETTIPERDSVAVFPVTDYLLGQIKLIEDMPLTPLQLFISGDHVDSVWLKREDIRKMSEPFLAPVIDSVYLRKYFTGNTFLDQTVNAATIAYEVIPDSATRTPFSRISVYISPATNQVERIYMVKELDDASQQLTWKSGQWLSIRTVKDDGIKEEKIIWNFDE